MLEADNDITHWNSTHNMIMSAFIKKSILEVVDSDADWCKWSRPTGFGNSARRRLARLPPW